MFDTRQPTARATRPGPLSALLSGAPPTHLERELTVLVTLACAVLNRDATARRREAAVPSAPTPLEAAATDAATAPTGPSLLDWSDAHPLAAELEHRAPDVGLATSLTALNVADVDDAGLIEVIAAWERVGAWVVASQAVALNELRRRREAQGRDSYTGDEIAARLATTRASGEGRVADARALEQLPAVWDALTTGHIDARKAAVLTEELLAVPAGARDDVTRLALTDADARTAPQLRARIRRAALAVDPAAAHDAHERARGNRRVELHPCRDGMAWVDAYLPADQAVAVHAALTALADAHGPSDPRSMDARRADALVDVVSRWLDAGHGPDGQPLPTRQRRRPHLAVTATAATLLGLDEQPCTLAGYGPISAAMARDIAASATWTPLLLDASTGGLAARGHRSYRPSAAQSDWIVDRDPTCTFPGCRVPASRCDIDHNEPFDPTRPAEAQTIADAMDAKCRHHHRMKTHGGWRTRRDPVSGRTTWSAPTGHEYAAPPEDPPVPRPPMTADDRPPPFLPVVAWPRRPDPTHTDRPTPARPTTTEPVPTRTDGAGT